MNILDRQYEELGTNFRSVWEFYIKFYTAFLAVNFTGLGLVIQYIQLEQRQPIVWSFIFQNILSACTALGVAAYSKHVTRQQLDLVALMLQASPVAVGSNTLALGSTVPTKLAVWGGLANAFSHALFIACWIAALFMPSPRFPMPNL